jgi:hypothetical protein
MQVPARPPKRRRRRPARYAEQDVVEERRVEATATETDIEASAPQPQGTTMDSATEPKRMRGIRKPNQYPKKGVTFMITRVGEEGQILEPLEYISKFRNAIGVSKRSIEPSNLFLEWQTWRT